MAELHGVAASRFPARPAGGRAGARRQPRGDAGQPRRLHPLQPLRPRLPRGAGERRDRHGRPRASRRAIVFDMADPMGASTCVACGECVQACPTGALMEASALDAEGRGDSRDFEREVRSVCPYCGVGCQVAYKISDGRIAWVDGVDGPANEGRLCVKGRFGFDYVTHPHRLTRPLIRRDDAPAKGLNVDPANPLHAFPRGELGGGAGRRGGRARPAAAARTAGPSVAGFGSAKCSNEEAYLFQKLIRQGFGHNNVDHCTRLCHASSVAALMENIGSGGGHGHVQRDRARRPRHRHRRQPHREPSGGGDLLQAVRQARGRADRHGPARHGAEAARHAGCCSSGRGRTWRCSTRS